MSRGKEKYLILFQKKEKAASTYADKKTLEFSIELATNTFTNYSNMCIVLPIAIKKETNKAQNVVVITVNNCFCHWLNEIDARRYPDNARILPTNNTIEIYQYAAQQTRQLPLLIEHANLGKKVTDFLGLIRRKIYFTEFHLGFLHP